MKVNKYVLWALRIIPAAILLQTLFFKFTAHPDSVDLFMKLGAEPFGRIGTGVLEFIASILLLWPKYTKYGAILAAGLMVGAIGSHVFVLGIEHAGDGGLLFGMAITVFLISAFLVFYYKDQLLSSK